MRRLWAAILAAWFSFMLIAPSLLASDADSELPACCRRNGAHKCTLGSDTTGPALQAGVCAEFPHGAAAPVRVASAVFGRDVSAARLLAMGLAKAAVEARLGFVLRRDFEDRGPPFLS